ncbi:MAG: ATP-dependent zinc protease [Legionellaceae bacterium]|nr:ATP-dependent zinc protease [Legionellaceae bacterium]
MDWRKCNISPLIVGIVLLGATSLAAAAAAEQQSQEVSAETKVLGPVEDIRINRINYQTASRVDTGAKSSSLHAEELYIFSLNGEEYIRFFTVDEQGNRYQLTKKIHDLVEVKNTSGVSEKRYVIREKIELNGREFMVNINLKDRSNMKYKFLMGRDLIKQGEFLVDVAEESDKKTAQGAA